MQISPEVVPPAAGFRESDYARLRETESLIPGEPHVALPAQLVPAAPCELCGHMAAPSTMSVHYAGGRVPRRVCALCSDLIKEVRARFDVAQARQRAAFEEQFFGVVRDVRAGVTDLPTFDQPDL